MARFQKTHILFVRLSLVLAFCFCALNLSVAEAQTNKPLTYPEIITALNNKKFPLNTADGIWRNKDDVINWLINQIKTRRVDKPLTKDREDDLWQAGATNELIESIRANTPVPTTPTPTPKPTPLSLDEFEKINFILSKKGDKWGYVDEKKRELIPFEYDDAKPFNDGIAIVGKRSESYGGNYYFFINKANENINTYFTQNSDGIKGLFEGFLVNGREGIGFQKIRNGNDACEIIAISRSGREVFSKSTKVSCYSLEIIPYTNGYATYEKSSEEWITIDTKGNEFKGRLSENILTVGQNIQPSDSTKKDFWVYGFSTITGDEIVPPFYIIGSLGSGGRYHEGLGRFSEGLSPVARRVDVNDSDVLEQVGVSQYWEFSAKRGFIDKNGVEIIPLVYQEVRPFSDGLAAVRFDGKWFYIDKSENIFIPTKEGVIRLQSALNKRLSNGPEPTQKCIKVSDKRVECRYGYIDANKKVVIPFIYKEAKPFENGIACVTKPDETGCNYIDTLGNRATSPPNQTYSSKIFKQYSTYSNSKGFKDGLHCVFQLEKKTFKSKAGFIDVSGRVVIPLIYEDCKDFSAGLAPVKLNDLWGFIDKSGKEIVKPKFKNVSGFSQDLAAVLLTENDRISGTYFRDSLFGDHKSNLGEGCIDCVIYLDTTGKQVQLFSELRSFSEGLAAVESGDKEGFIDKTGKIVIPLIFDRVGDFRDGKAGVEKDGKGFFIDKNGTEYRER